MEGCTDGTWKGLRYFSCKHGRGFFSPVSNLEPDQREVVSSPKANNSPPLPSAQPHDPAVPTQIFREPVQPPTVIAMGSAVEVGDPQDPHYGTLRWMGILPGHEELVAGIEMVSVCMCINSVLILFCNRMKTPNVVEMATLMACSISSVAMVELTSAHSYKLDLTKD